MHDALTDIAIDKGRPTPAYLQLSHQLAEAIRTGDLGSGSALPSERELADRLGLSRMTVRRAFEQLADARLVEQRQGSGTYVRGRTVVQTVDRLLGFRDEAKGFGLETSSRLLAARPAPADHETAEALELDEGAEVLLVTRLRSAGDEPLALQTAHLPPRFLALDVGRLERLGSLYATLAEQFGVRPAHARQTVAARLASRDEQRLLGLDRPGPVLGLERCTYDDGGKPFEYVRSAYRGDRYRLALELRPPEG